MEKSPCHLSWICRDDPLTGVAVRLNLDDDACDENAYDEHADEEHAYDKHAYDENADEDEADADDAKSECHLSLHLSEWRLRFGPNGVLSSIVAEY